MKKRFSIILCLVMLFSCVSLSACTKKDVSNSKYVGTWKAESMSVMNESEAFDDDILLVLNPDGTAQFVSEEETTNCKWQETSNGFKLTDGSKLTFTEDGDGVKAKIIGVELHFTKED